MISLNAYTLEIKFTWKHCQKIIYETYKSLQILIAHTGWENTRCLHHIFNTLKWGKTTYPSIIIALNYVESFFFFCQVPPLLLICLGSPINLLFLIDCTFDVLSTVEILFIYTNFFQFKHEKIEKILTMES